MQALVLARTVDLPDQFDLIAVQQELRGIRVRTAQVRRLMPESVIGNRNQIEQHHRLFAAQVLEAHKIEAAGPAIAILQRYFVAIRIGKLRPFCKQDMRPGKGGFHLTGTMSAPVGLRARTVTGRKTERTHLLQTINKLRQRLKPFVIYRHRHRHNTFSMILLILITLLWAFSFSLIGVYLAGQVDSYFSVLTRVLLATVVFLPLLSWRTPPRVAFTLMGIGAIQLGLMYLFYYHSFLLLSVPEVLLFTIFTPLYITLINDLLAQRYSLSNSLWNLLVAGCAVVGAAIIRWDNLSGDFWRGFFVVQGANLCFATGQVAYKQFMQSSHMRGETLLPRQTFGWFFIGASLVATLAWLTLGKPQYPTNNLQWGILLWLGAVASGLGYFLWNKGATQVSAGTLAAMNNALIPAGLLVNLLIWNRDANLPRLCLGGAVIVLAVAASEWHSRRRR